jgi:arabinoxylan arabinofuranohydrolase
LVVRVASAGSGGNVELHLDSATGAMLGSCTVPVTGDWQTWVTQTCPLSGASGVHDVYLVYTGSGGYLFNVEWFALRPADGIGPDGG